ncbi:MAG: biopolymer transporter ExbD [Gemmatimonadetes bacterium]|nr:biopolymer transporter ExbD [Gemmatimonadota bacterium]
MAVFRRRARIVSEIPTASMADIAFNLLIFFLVTTIFDQEKGLPLTLPTPEQQIEVLEKNILRLVIQPDGALELRRGEAPATERVVVAQVGEIWRAEASRNPDMIAAVATHPAASYHQMIDVLDELRAAGARRVSLQVLEEQP